MSCFTGCFSKQRDRNITYNNRSTQLPMNFTLNQIGQLRKKFQKVSGSREFITLEAFKKNMGILGLHCSQQFSERLFNAFDLDNDSKINFQDFLQYMQILKGKKDKDKAKISFKMIVPPRHPVITKDIFKKFLNDFFISWSYVTNIDITPQIKQRANQYLQFLFKKVQKDTGKAEINLQYYETKLYKDKDYLQSFEFITQGMADIFIGQKSNDPQTTLYKVIKQLLQIKQTVFQMSNEQSCFYEPVKIETQPYDLPVFRDPIFKKSSTNKVNYKNRKEDSTNGFQTRPQRQYVSNANIFHNYDNSETHIGTKSRDTLFQSKNLHAKYSAQSTLLGCLKKKLKFIEQKIQKIVQQTKHVYQVIKDKYETKHELKNRKSAQTAKNVHKRIRKVEGNMVFIGDQNWNMVLNMMIGIQMAVRSVKGIQEIICEQPKDFNLKYYFELIPRKFGDQNYHSTIYSFTDYAPNTFNHIRKMFKIDNQQYIQSIGPNKLMASLMMGEVSSMTSLTSQGKSGSFFYYTADGKYMLKTIHYRQYRFLRKILEDYYFYLKKNPDTLITKFYGLHKLLEKNEVGQEIGRYYFVIMANVFNTKQKIVERYDIKGSWYGRETDDTDPCATKKDNDFKKREPLHLSEQNKINLLRIIKKDAEFFEQHEIIDYSLLIGVIRKSDNLSDVSEACHQSMIIKQRDQSVIMMRESKLYIGIGQSEVAESYIFGIIDILTLYDSRKALQYYFKRIVYGEGISAVPPNEYAQRFYNFIQGYVFAG